MLKEGLNYKEKYRLAFEGIKEQGLKEGREEGREEGIEEGIKEGIKEGKEKVYKDAILSGINPMDIGCPKETYEKLVEEIRSGKY